MTRPDAELLHIVIRNDGTVHVYVNPEHPAAAELDADQIGGQVTDLIKQYQDIKAGQ